MQSGQAVVVCFHNNNIVNAIFAFVAGAGGMMRAKAVGFGAAKMGC
jgi:hypothetical protein